MFESSLTRAAAIAPLREISSTHTTIRPGDRADVSVLEACVPKPHERGSAASCRLNSDCRRCQSVRRQAEPLIMLLSCVS